MDEHLRKTAWFVAMWLAGVGSVAVTAPARVIRGFLN